MVTLFAMDVLSSVHNVLADSNDEPRKSRASGAKGRSKSCCLLAIIPIKYILLVVVTGIIDGPP